jgi:hypothetical protein
VCVCVFVVCAWMSGVGVETLVGHVERFYFCLLGAFVLFYFGLCVVVVCVCVYLCVNC